jgi:hypothetical protein
MTVVIYSALHARDDGVEAFVGGLLVHFVLFEWDERTEP